MNTKQQPFRNISDTAIWAATYRARESERPNAIFRDPFARRLAGERGDFIAAQVRSHRRQEWAWIMRTVLFDRYLTELIEQGTDLVLNLAAGLDARPYRMALPPTLQWVEVDLPELLDYKERILSSEKPLCLLERVRLDLADASGRRELFSRLSRQCKKAAVITEGLLIYLTPGEVASLATDLAAEKSFRNWILDLASPGLLRMLQRKVGAELERASAPLKFAPPEGPEFFDPYGWRPASVSSILKEAARAKRIPFWMRLLAKLPESSGRQGSRIWSGICLLERRSG